LENPYQTLSKVNPPFAWLNREEGRREIINDVFHALTHARLSGGEYQVVLTVIDRTWGFQKESANISLGYFEKVTNLSRQSVINALKLLEQKRIIATQRYERVKTNEYLFNKHYDTWLIGSQVNHTTLPLEHYLSIDWDAQIRSGGDHWVRLAGDIRARDNHTCLYCGFSSDSPREIPVDHIVPRSRGGLTIPPNLVCTCLPCNQRKGTSPIHEFLPTLDQGRVDSFVIPYLRGAVKEITLLGSQVNSTTRSQVNLTTLVNQITLCWSSLLDQGSQPPEASRSLTKVTSKETLKVNIKETYTVIFDHWNSLSIITHKKMTDKMKTAVKSALGDYSKEEICQAMSNYAEVLQGEDYFWKYKWTIDEFVRRGLEKFMDAEVARQNYEIREERRHERPARQVQPRRHPISYISGSGKPEGQD